jgi:acetyltransferase, GNAT family
MEAERILLRYWQESGAAALFKYTSDPDVEPRAGWPARRLVEKSCEIIQPFFPNGTVWTIVLKVTGEPIDCRCN